MIIKMYFKQIVDIEIYKPKLEFTVFTEPFLNESEAMIRTLEEV